MKPSTMMSQTWRCRLRSRRSREGTHESCGESELTYQTCFHQVFAANSGANCSDSSFDCVQLTEAWKIKNVLDGSQYFLESSKNHRHPSLDFNSQPRRATRRHQREVEHIRHGRFPHPPNSSRCSHHQDPPETLPAPRLNHAKKFNH